MEAVSNVLVCLTYIISLLTVYFACKRTEKVEAALHSTLDSLLSMHILIKDERIQYELERILNRALDSLDSDKQKKLKAKAEADRLISDMGIDVKEKRDKDKS